LTVEQISASEELCFIETTLYLYLAYRCVTFGFLTAAPLINRIVEYDTSLIDNSYNLLKRLSESILNVLPFYTESPCSSETVTRPYISTRICIPGDYEVKLVDLSFEVL